MLRWCFSLSGLCVLYKTNKWVICHRAKIPIKKFLFISHFTYAPLWVLLLTAVSGVRTVTAHRNASWAMWALSWELAMMEDAIHPAHKLRHLCLFPSVKGFCSPGGVQKSSFYTFRTYSTVTVGTISSSAPQTLPEMFGPRAKLSRGFSQTIFWTICAISSLTWTNATGRCVVLYS